MTKFYDGKYLTAAEKDRIAKAFERLIKNNFEYRYFTKALYKHLSLHFGFIAHYDIGGFYGARFYNIIGRRATFQSIRNASKWTFVDDNTSGTADLNLEIQKIALKYEASVLITALIEEKAALASRIQQDQARLDALNKL